MAEKRLRILVAKPGLDGHDRGAKIIARALRDGGFEVIYTGLHQTPEMIAEAAVQEDADAVGLSVLSGAHMTLFPEVMRLLKERGAGESRFSAAGSFPTTTPTSSSSWACGRSLLRVHRRKTSSSGCATTSRPALRFK